MMYVGLASGFVLGAVVAWAWLSRRQASAEATAAELRNQLYPLQSQVDVLQSKLSTAEKEQAAAQTRLESFRQMEASFKALAAEALHSSQEQFLKLANEKLADRVVAPLNLSLGKVEEGLKGLEGQRAAIEANVKGLTTAQSNLQAETGRLAEALKSSTVRGHWGEIQLKRIIELAGMIEHCDFETQVTVETPEGRQRPDVVVRLPGDRCVVVDAKAPLKAYLAAIDARTDEERRLLVEVHEKDVKIHVDALSKKPYARLFARSPEFVVLFLPTEMSFSPDVIEYAAARGVIPATPTTLIALLKTVHAGWQQQQVAENAEQISRTGRELHERLVTFMGHVARMGNALKAAVTTYEESVGSLDRMVLPKARELRDLGAAGAREIPEPPRIENVRRIPDPIEIPRK